MRSKGLLIRFDQALAAHYKAEILVGVDEVGRGPLAGPVVAACVAFKPQSEIALEDVRDSKLLSPKKRKFLYNLIRAQALAVATGWASPDEIDEKNILNATFLAMRRALSELKISWTKAVVAVDGNLQIPEFSHRQVALAKGDQHSLAIASASIIAKVARDRWMERLDRRYPGYGFASHRGYGTAKHWEALTRLGPSPIHRKSFEPVSQLRLPNFKPSVKQ